MDFFYNLRFNTIEWRTKLLLALFKNNYKEKLLSYRYAFENKTGLEIGGPSDFFSSEIFPIY